jgi:hypothetical protein
MLSRLNRFFTNIKSMLPQTAETIGNSHNIDNIKINHLKMIKRNILWRQVFRFFSTPYVGLKHPGIYSQNNAFGNHNYVKFNAILKPLFNVESKLQELFELSEMSRYLSASVVNFDFCEMSYIDNYKESYPFTVNLLKDRVFMLNVNIC